MNKILEFKFEAKKDTLANERKTERKANFSFFIVKKIDILQKLVKLR